MSIDEWKDPRKETPDSDISAYYLCAIEQESFDDVNYEVLEYDFKKQAFCNFIQSDEEDDGFSSIQNYRENNDFLLDGYESFDDEFASRIKFYKIIEPPKEDKTK